MTREVRLYINENAKNNACYVRMETRTNGGKWADQGVYGIAGTFDEIRQIEIDRQSYWGWELISDEGAVLTFKKIF